MRRHTYNLLYTSSDGAYILAACPAIDLFVIAVSIPW